MMRRPDLCPGGPAKCSEVNSVICSICDTEYDLSDLRAGCPKCGRRTQYHRRECAQCPAVKLAEDLNRSPFSALIERAIDLEALLDMPGISISLDDITAEEFGVIKLIKSERYRYTEKKRTEKDREQRINQNRR